MQANALRRLCSVKNKRPSVRYDEPGSGYLQFWTQSANLRVSHDPLLEALTPESFHGLSYGDGYWKNIVVADTVVGVVHLNIAISVIDFEKPHPFILLSRTSTTRTRDTISSVDDYKFAPETKEGVPWDQRQFNYDAQELANQTTRADVSNEFAWDWYSVMLVDKTVGVATRLGIGVIETVGLHQSAPERLMITL